VKQGQEKSAPAVQANGNCIAVNWLEGFIEKTVIKGLVKSGKVD
jgi:hypothetical protein